jgi:hypothetical protein
MGRMIKKDAKISSIRVDLFTAITCVPCSAPVRRLHIATAWKWVPVHPELSMF